MGTQSKTALSLGILFFVIGAIWMAAIFIRCQKYMPQEKKKISYTQIYQKHHERLTVILSPLSVKKYMPKVYIIHFWAIAYWEFICALLYLLSGIFLLRAYPAGRHLAFYALFSDIILKNLIVTYQYYVLAPLKPVFQSTNIMFTYFTSDAGFDSQISSHLTGIKLVQSGAIFFAISYGIYLLVCFYALSRMKTRPKD
jgi:hypothetical protein